MILTFALLACGGEASVEDTANSAITAEQAPGESVAAPPTPPPIEEAPEICPITGEQGDPNISHVIEGQRVIFATEEAREEFLRGLGKDD